jgi:hypothetical protein
MSARLNLMGNMNARGRKNAIACLGERGAVASVTVHAGSLAGLPRV